MELPFVEPKELLSHIGKATTAILDVRDDDYDVGGHLDGSMHIPVGIIANDPKTVGAQLEQYDTIFVYCMLSQQRGPKSARLLHEALPKKCIQIVSGGYTKVFEFFARNNPRLLINVPDHK